MLLPDGHGDGGRVAEAPDYFSDLNLDQAVDAIVGDREYLKPHFAARLTTADAVAYRHQVFADLERPDTLAAVRGFAEAMGEVERLVILVSDRRFNRYEPEAWLLEAARRYCEAVQRFASGAGVAGARSRGLGAIRAYAGEYAASQAFGALSRDVDRVREGLAAVRYAMTIQGDRVKVSLYEGEPDFSAEVAATFERFKQGTVEDYLARFGPGSLNHIEARILELVARLDPEPFAALDAFGARHRSFRDEVLVRFAREVQFYLAYLELMAKLQATGLSFCHPSVGEDKEVRVRDAFDIALAAARLGEDAAVVCNDVELHDPERIIVVTGPNQGGKTTFARMFGQLHHLAGIGVPVPGTEARLTLCDQLFTHFEREENLANLRGKLEDDLVRVHRILQRATPDSAVVMNESFGSTSLHDALVLGETVLAQMIELDLLCVYVTFIDELASLGESIVSMTSTVPPGDPTARTFKVVRRPADGLAYAVALAERHGLSYRRVRERVTTR